MMNMIVFENDVLENVKYDNWVWSVYLKEVLKIKLKF